LTILTGENAHTAFVVRIRKCRTQQRKIALRQGERNLQGRHLCNGDQSIPGQIGAAHDMTFATPHDAGTSADRRHDPGVPQPGPLHGKSRLARRNIGSGDPDLRVGLFGLGLTGNGSGQQLLGSPERSVRFGQHGSVAGQGCLAAGDLRLELAIIEAEQKIPGCDLHTVMDALLNDGAVDAGPHSHACRWFDPADAGSRDRHCLCAHRSGDDSDGGQAVLQ
jgi:hypothetical protein